jgi:putative transposase
MGLSERRACFIVGADRKMVRYRSCRPPEIELRARLRELANERRRFGIGGCSSCGGGKASRRGSIASTGSTGRKG